MDKSWKYKGFGKRMLRIKLAKMTDIKEIEDCYAWLRDTFVPKYLAKAVFIPKKKGSCGSEADSH